MLELSGIECSEEERNDVAIGLVSEFTNVISGHAVTSLKDYFLDNHCYKGLLSCSC